MNHLTTQPIFALGQKSHCYTEMHREDAEIHKEKDSEALRDSSV
jgi:hypothetical protein